MSASLMVWRPQRKSSCTKIPAKIKKGIGEWSCRTEGQREVCAVLCGALRSVVVLCLEHSSDFAFVQSIRKQQVHSTIVDYDFSPDK